MVSENTMVNHGRMNMYRDCVPVTDGWHDTEADSTVVGTITALVAEAEGGDELELSPLYDVIDVDIIDRLLDSNENPGEGGAIIGFQYRNWNIFVRADGRVRVCDGTRHCEVAPVFDGTMPESERV